MIVGGSLFPHWEVTVIWERSARGDSEHPGREPVEREAPVFLGSVVTVSLQQVPLLGVATSHCQGWRSPIVALPHSLRTKRGRTSSPALLAERLDRLFGDDM